jgi:predicted ATPase
MENSRITMLHNKLYVITGGPGSGKSTLLDVLRQRGFVCMTEAGRAIIQDQLLIGGTALPWADQAAFAERMLAWDLRAYQQAQAASTPVLFDRGIPDVLGYLRLSRLPIPEPVRQAVDQFRYHRQVFIAPPWWDIYTQDAERKQSFAEAEATYRTMLETYTGLGYELIPLPLVSPSERADFVQSFLL